LIDEELWEASGSKVAFDSLEESVKSSKFWVEIPYLSEGETIISE